MQTLLILSILAFIITTVLYYFVPKKFKFGPIQEEWLQSLEQNPERQFKGSLGTKSYGDTYGACCLGELGLIGKVCRWQDNSLIADISSSASFLYEVYEKVGLYGPTGEASPEETGLDSLSRMNDRTHTWPEIAAHVRKHPKAYFSKFV